MGINLIDGLPLKSRTKVKYVLLFFILLMINHNITLFSLDYPYRNWISIIFVTLAIVFSIGGKISELIIIATCIFILLSNAWDLSVLDITNLRKGVFIGAIVVLIVSLIIGKVSISNLYSILQGQIGVKK